MEITHKKDEGFALLISVIFMAVMLSLSLSIGSLAYKQTILAGSATQSQYAFYAADAGLECLLYADYNKRAFENLPGPTDLGYPKTIIFACGDQSVDMVMVAVGTDYFHGEQSVTIDGTRCVDVSIYKPNGLGKTWLFSQGYDIPCGAFTTASRYASRGLRSNY